MVQNKINYQSIITTLILAVVFVCQYYFFKEKLDLGEFNNPFYQRDSIYSLIISLILATIVMPIFEEFAFRFFLGNTKKIKHVFGFIAIILLALLNFIYDLNYFFILTIISGLIYLPSFLKNKKTTLLQLFLISIVFSIFHFIGYDMPFVSTVSVLLYFTGLGLVFGLIRIKFNFIAAIISHILYNSFFVLISLNAYDNNIKEVNCNDYKIIFNENSLFTNKRNTIKNNGKILNIINGDIVQSLKIYYPNDSLINNYFQRKALVNYDLKVHKIDRSNIDLNQVLHCLEDMKILQKIK